MRIFKQGLPGHKGILAAAVMMTVGSFTSAQAEGLQPITGSVEAIAGGKASVSFAGANFVATVPDYTPFAGNAASLTDQARGQLGSQLVAMKALAKYYATVNSTGGAMLNATEAEQFRCIANQIADNMANANAKTRLGTASDLFQGSGPIMLTIQRGMNGVYTAMTGAACGGLETADVRILGVPVQYKSGNETALRVMTVGTPAVSGGQVGGYTVYAGDTALGQKVGPNQWRVTLSPQGRSNLTRAEAVSVMAGLYGAKLPQPKVSYLFHDEVKEVGGQGFDPNYWSGITAKQADLHAKQVVGAAQ